MDQIKYQGYARDRGFAPIQVNTGTVDAILQQGNALSRQLRENQSIETQNRNAYLNALQNKNQVEAQNRASNFEFNERNRDKVQEWELYNQKQRAENFKIQSDNVAQVIAPLAQLSQTIGKELVNWQKQKNEAEMQEGMMDVLLNGNNPEKQAAVDASVDNMRKSDEVIQTTADQLQDVGAAPEAVKATRKLSKWRELGRAKASALLASMEYGSWVEQQYASNTETQIQFTDPNTGQPITITPRTALGPDQKAAVNQVLMKQFLKEKGLLGMNPGLIIEALTSIRKQNNELLAKETTAFERAENERQLDEINMQFTAGVETDPVEAFNESIRQLTHQTDERTGRRMTPKDASNYLLDRLVAAGNVEAINAIAESPGYMEGKTWGQLRESEFEAARQKIIDNTIAADNRRDQIESEELEARGDEIMESLYAEGPVDEAVVRQLKDNMKKDFGGRYDKRLDDYLENSTYQARSEDDQERELKRLYNAGQLNMAEINSGKFTRTVIDKGGWARKAQEMDDTTKAPMREVGRKALQEELRKASRFITGEDANRSPSYYFAEAHAFKRLDEIARAHYRAGKPLDEAYTLAYKEIATNIRNDNVDSKQSLTYTFDTDSQQFKRWKVDGKGSRVKQAEQEIRNIVSQVANGGQAAVLNRVLVKREQAEAAGNPNQPIPDIFWVIADQLPTNSKMSVYDIIDAQRNKHGLGKRQADHTEQIQRNLSPRLQELLTRRLTGARTSRALYGGGVIGPGQERQAIQQIAQGLGVDPVDVATFINYETAGTLTNGKYRRGLDIWGGDGGRYLGWIQFSPDNQQKYGVKPGMNPGQMATAVIRYLKDAGIRPGDGLAEMYQAIQAPAYLAEMRRRGQAIGADSNDSVANHIRRMNREHRPGAERWLMESGGIGGRDYSSPWRDPRVLSASAKKTLNRFAMTSGYGASESFRQGRTHGGNDYGTPENTKLALKTGGTVVDVGAPNEYNGGYGGFVDIKLDNGSTIRMAHLNDVRVRPGQRLRPKQVAALTGSTGRSTGPHLHLEAFDSRGRKKDPSSYASLIYADI